MSDEDEQPGVTTRAEVLQFARTAVELSECLDIVERHFGCDDTLTHMLRAARSGLYEVLESETTEADHQLLNATVSAERAARTKLPPTLFTDMDEGASRH